MKIGNGDQSEMMAEIQKAREQDSDAGGQKYWQETAPQHHIHFTQRWSSSQRHSEKQVCENARTFYGVGKRRRVTAGERLIGLLTSSVLH